MVTKAQELIAELCEDTSDSSPYRNAASLIKAAGNYWASQNSGLTPDTTSGWMQDAETDEMYDLMMKERNYWEREAKKAWQVMKRAGDELTIANLWRYVR